MADREKVFQKRRFGKLYCKALGKCLTDAIEENEDPDLIEFKFENYNAEVSKVLESCSELATFDKSQDFVFLDKFKKETDCILDKYLNYSKDFKENAAVNNQSIDEYDEEDSCILLKDLVEENLNDSLEEDHIEIDFCDVTLACDDKQVLTQKLSISSSSDKKIFINCENEPEEENSNEIDEESSSYQNDELLIKTEKDIDCPSDEYSKSAFPGDLYFEKDGYFEFEEKGDCNSPNREVFWYYCDECSYKDKKEIYLDCHKKVKHEENLCMDSILNDSADMYYTKYIEPDIEKLIAECGIYCDDYFSDNEIEKDVLEEFEYDDSLLLLKYEEPLVKTCKESCSEKSIKQEIEDAKGLPSEKEKKFHITRLKEKFICEHCEKHFENEKYLKGHLKMFHEESPHPCNQCGEKFGNTESFFARGLYDFDRFECHKCGYQTFVPFNIITPNCYCVNCQISSSEQILNSYDSSSDLNTKVELTFASVREGSWSQREDG